MESIKNFYLLLTKKNYHLILQSLENLMVYESEYVNF